MDKLKWKWVYIPYLDAPDKQKESAIKAGYAKVYFKSEVDASIARLEDKIQMHDFFWEGCGFAKRGFKNTIAVSEAFDKLEAENAELKQKLEDAKATAYAEMVDAGMRERRLRRALWLTRANMARGLAEMCEHQFDCCGVSRSRFLVGYDKKSKPKRMTTTEWGELWRKIEQKCRTKAEEYK